jgi:putative endonuclease
MLLKKLSPVLCTWLYSAMDQVGKKGEALAVQYFIERNYTILHQNWRYRHWEVDIIASRAGILHFIEVKTRSSLLFGYPEENVDSKKIQYLINASEAFLYQYPQWQRIQFDILSITISKYNADVDYFLIEDVYL